MRRPTPPRLALVATALLLAATACGTAGPDGGDAAAPDSSGDPSAPDDKQEVDEAQPRLVVATDAGATVLDAATGDELTSVETEIRPRLTVGGDGRHVFLVQGDADLTQVLDAGSWTSAHGDHTHSYVADPALRDVRIEGGKPVHVVSHGGRTAIFHDDDGSAAVFDDNGLLIDQLDAASVPAEAPHHGVVVPIAEDAALVSIPGAEALPVGVALVGDDGTERARFEQCPELHGETVVGEIAVFGCGDGVMLVDGDQVTTIPNPDASGERIGGFVSAESSPVVLGDYAADSLALVDTAAATLTVVPAGGVYGPFALGPHGEVLALTTDGTLRVFDPASGAEQAALPLLDAFELPTGHGGVKPAMAVADHTVFVTDPATSSIVPVDLEAMTPGPPIELDDAPTGLVVVGNPPHEGAAGHDDDH